METIKKCASCDRTFYNRPHSHYCVDCHLKNDRPKMKLCMICGEIARHQRSMLCQTHFDQQLKPKVDAL